MSTLNLSERPMSVQIITATERFFRLDYLTIWIFKTPLFFTPSSLKKRFVSIKVDKKMYFMELNSNMHETLDRMINV